MKPSHYNYILSKDSKSYWYNGVSHKFFTLPIELGNKIKPLICNPEILRGCLIMNVNIREPI